MMKRCDSQTETVSTGAANVMLDLSEKLTKVRSELAEHQAALRDVRIERDCLRAEIARHKQAVECVLLACDMLPQLDSGRTKEMIAEALEGADEQTD